MANRTTSARQQRPSLEPIREESVSEVKSKDLGHGTTKTLVSSPTSTKSSQRSLPKSPPLAWPKIGDRKLSKRRPMEGKPRKPFKMFFLDPEKCTCAKFEKDQPGSPLDSKRSYSSILERPFIFRRAESLDHAVTNEEKRLIEIYACKDRNSGPTVMEDESASSKVELTESVSTLSSSKSTETICTGSDASPQKSQLEYLMGLPPCGEEMESKVDLEYVIPDAKEEFEFPGETQCMKLAQRYLRVHRIFEFFQFLIAHLLSAVPENPINFLLDLLDRCIIYRAGMGNPPLLYDKKHIVVLFNLMDRMRTGYIDQQQYVTGMKTLGICSFNPNPLLTVENTIFKDTFVDEAYENLVSILNDILRKRWICPTGRQGAPINTPPPTPLQLLSGITSKTKWATVSNKSTKSNKTVKNQSEKSSSTDLSNK